MKIKLTKKYRVIYILNGPPGEEAYIEVARWKINDENCKFLNEKDKAEHREKLNSLKVLGKGKFVKSLIVQEY